MLLFLFLFTCANNVCARRDPDYRAGVLYQLDDKRRARDGDCTALLYFVLSTALPEPEDVGTADLRKDWRLAANYVPVPAEAG